MTAATHRAPLTLAGFSLDAWAFGIRTWLSMVIALYLSFWLQIEDPSTASLTVAVLAFPARGQGFEKAIFRAIATVVGLAASIVIVSVFSQAGWMYIVVLAIWIGLCVFVSGFFDGFRSYAAILGAFTVCFVVIEQLDAPQNVFELAHERGAAIFVGILSVALVNDVLFAPDFYPSILARLKFLQARIASIPGSGGKAHLVASPEAARALQDITSLRPMITSLAWESSIGPNRYVAARTVMVDLVFELAAARIRAILASTKPSEENDFALAWMSRELRRREDDVLASLEDLAAGTAPKRARPAPLYRSHRIAAADGWRAAVHFLLAAGFLYAAGWNSTSVSLAFVGVLIGINTMSADQPKAATFAIIAALLGCVFAGLLEFVVLDGADAFPLLALGLFPFVVIPTLLMTLPNEGFAALGRSNLVFSVAIFQPTNVQSYDPQTFLFSSLFLCLAAFLLFVCQHIVPPLSAAAKRRILIRESRLDLKSLDRLRHGWPREEAMFRDATRVGLVMSTYDGDLKDPRDAECAMNLFDRAAALRLAANALDALPDDTPDDLRLRANRAVAEADEGAIAACARAIAADRRDRRRDVPDAVAALATAGLILFNVAQAAEEI